MGAEAFGEPEHGLDSPPGGLRRVVWIAGLDGIEVVEELELDSLPADLRAAAHGRLAWSAIPSRGPGTHEVPPPILSHARREPARLAWRVEARRAAPEWTVQTTLLAVVRGLV
jgi:hypothetical protein